MPWEYPYRGLGLITLVGTTYDTSLLYAATPGSAGVAILRPLTRACGAGSVHYQSGTTSHVAMAVISRPPLPHAQAGRRPRLICYLHRCVHQTDNTRHTPHRRARSYSIIHESSHPPIKPLCDARAIELGSHRRAQPAIAAREVSQSGLLGIPLHSLVHPASGARSPSKRSTTVVLSAVAPTWLWATPWRRALSTAHIVG